MPISGEGDDKERECVRARLGARHLSAAVAIKILLILSSRLDREMFVEILIVIVVVVVVIIVIMMASH